MMDGRKSSFRGLSESSTQCAVAPNAAERRGGRFKRLFLIDFRAMIFIGPVCGEFLGWGDR